MNTEESTPCAKDPDKWFSGSTGVQGEAKAICRLCPFKKPCLQLALDNKEEWGVWGGTTPAQRSLIQGKNLTKATLKCLLCRKKDLNAQLVQDETHPSRQKGSITCENCDFSTSSSPAYARRILKLREEEHGAWSAYLRRNCRCDKCVAFVRASNRQAEYRKAERRHLEKKQQQEAA